MRSTGSHTVVVDDVFVPEAAVSLIRLADAWHPIWNTVLGAALPLIMSPYVGIADAAVDAALAMVAGRDEPHVLQLVGEMITAHTLGADIVTTMFSASDDLQFDNTDQHASLTLARKAIASEALIDTVRLAIEATGGVGYSRRSDIERLYRDVHGCLFHPLPRGQADPTHRTSRAGLRSVRLNRPVGRTSCTPADRRGRLDHGLPTSAARSRAVATFSPTARTKDPWRRPVPNDAHPRCYGGGEHAHRRCVSSAADAARRPSG